MELSHKIIIGLLIILILLTVYKKQENAGNVSGSTNYNTEAISNIASVYSESVNGTASFNNMRITGNLDAGNFKGIIVSWSGSIANIPPGWGFCDGTIYTALDGTQLQSPDLRSIFILGASKQNTPTTQVGGPSGQPSLPNIGWLTPKQVGNFGGAEKVKLEISEMPSHTHNIWSGAGAWNLNTTPWVGQGITAGDMSRSVAAIVPTGGSQPHENMPPFYALAYIIKL